MSEERDTRAQGSQREPENETGATRLLAGRIACVLGLVLAVGGGANISSGAVGILLGVLTLFFGLAASQGLIPGLERTDRSLPAREPRAE